MREVSMEQESWKVEKEETGRQLPEGPVPCSNNCGFFGSATTMNLCSLCYRDVVMKQTKAAEAAAALSAKHPLDKELPVEVLTDAISAVGSSDDATQSFSSSDQISTLPVQRDRCFTCKKRVGLTGFKCKCGNQFCSLHRYTDKHDCTYDYRAAARNAISRANPLIKADKVHKI